jgi:hypothetical protein
MVKLIKRIVTFFQFWKSPDFMGDPITAKTAWEVAKILED